MANVVAAIAPSSLFGARFVARAVNVFEHVIAAISRSYYERQTRIVLMSLSDDILADIGAERPYFR